MSTPHPSAVPLASVPCDLDDSPAAMMPLKNHIHQRDGQPLCRFTGSPLICKLPRATRMGRRCMNAGAEKLHGDGTYQKAVEYHRRRFFRRSDNARWSVRSQRHSLDTSIL